jgi:hypothetical protein
VSEWPTPEELREDLVEDIEGLLSVFERGARETEGLLELLAAGQALRRLDATDASEALLERTMRALRGAIPGASDSIRATVRVETWLLDLKDLADRHDTLAGAGDARSEREYADESHRLLLQLDSWRLGLLGLLELTEDREERAALREDLEILEDGPADAIMSRPELFEEVGPLANATLAAFRDDLADEDLDLAVTGDIFAAVSLAASPTAREEDALSVLRAVERPKEGRLRRLPPVRLPAAAAMPASAPKSFVWCPQDGTARAHLDFVPATESIEGQEPIELRVRTTTEDSPWGSAWRIRLFGIAAPLREGRALLLRTDIRAAEEIWKGSSLLVLHPETLRWTPWPMRDSDEAPA